MKRNLWLLISQFQLEDELYCDSSFIQIKKRPKKYYNNNSMSIEPDTYMYAK